MRVVIISMLLASLTAVSAQAAPKKSKPVESTPEPSYQDRVAADKDAIYQKGKALADSDNYNEALAEFQKANKTYPNDPQILNMLAYCQRKTGDTQRAIANYHKALDLKSNFPEAREYLAEAYIQAALEEIQTLKSYGPSAEEELTDVVKEFKEAAENL